MTLLEIKPAASQLEPLSPHLISAPSPRFCLMAVVRASGSGPRPSGERSGERPHEGLGRKQGAQPCGQVHTHPHPQRTTGAAATRKSAVCSMRPGPGQLLRLEGGQGGDLPPEGDSDCPELGLPAYLREELYSRPGKKGDRNTGENSRPLPALGPHPRAAALLPAPAVPLGLKHGVSCVYGLNILIY